MPAMVMALFTEMLIVPVLPLPAVKQAASDVTHLPGEATRMEEVAQNEEVVSQVPLVAAAVPLLSQ